MKVDINMCTLVGVGLCVYMQLRPIGHQNLVQIRDMIACVCQYTVPNTHKYSKISSISYLEE